MLRLPIPNDGGLRKRSGVAIGFGTGIRWSIGMVVAAVAFVALVPSSARAERRTATIEVGATVSDCAIVSVSRPDGTSPCAAAGDIQPQRQRCTAADAARCRTDPTSPAVRPDQSSFDQLYF